MKIKAKLQFFTVEVNKMNNKDYEVNLTNLNEADAKMLGAVGVPIRQGKEQEKTYKHGWGAYVVCRTGFPPGVIDSHRKPLSPAAIRKIGNGTVVYASVSDYQGNHPLHGKYVRLNCQAVQILEYVEYIPGMDAFEEEDGFTLSEDYVEDTDDDTPFTADTPATNETPTPVDDLDDPHPFGKEEDLGLDD